MANLQGKNIQIFEIIGKQSGDYNSTKYTVHKPIQYLQDTSDKLFLENGVPFSRCEVGDKLAIDPERIRFFSPTAERGKIRGNVGIVSRLVPKDPFVPAY